MLAEIQVQILIKVNEHGGFLPVFINVYMHSFSLFSLSIPFHFILSTEISGRRNQREYNLFLNIRSYREKAMTWQDVERRQFLNPTFLEV